MAGSIESHSTIKASKILNYTAVLNQYDFGFSTLTIHNGRKLTWLAVKSRFEMTNC
jgi:hypothetical protein